MIEETVLHQTEDNPSIHEIARNQGINHVSYENFKNKLYSYHWQRVQELTYKDFSPRLTFSILMQRMCNQNSTLTNRIRSSMKRYSRDLDFSTRATNTRGRRKIHNARCKINIRGNLA